MSNILERAQKSKLQDWNSPTEEKLFPLSRKSYSIIRSFRLDTQTWQDLQTLLEKTNQLTHRKVSNTRLIKALIYLGKNSSEQMLIKSLKEIAV